VIDLFKRKFKIPIQF